MDFSLSQKELEIIRESLTLYHRYSLKLINELRQQVDKSCDTVFKAVQGDLIDIESEELEVMSVLLIEIF